MLDRWLRSYYQKLLIEPLLRLRLSGKLSPTKITVLGALVGTSVAPLLAFQLSALALVCLLISGYCDTLDGSLARHQKVAAPHGAVFDIVSDRLVEVSVLVGLFLYAPSERALYVLMMLGSVTLCVTSFLVVGIFSNQKSEKSFHYSPGLIERPEAFAFWAVMIQWPHTFSILAPLFIASVLFTTLLRIVQFRRAPVT